MLILCVQLKRSERHASESEKKADQGKPRGAGNCATCASTTVQKQDKTETATTSVPGEVIIEIATWDYRVTDSSIGVGYVSKKIVVKAGGGKVWEEDRERLSKRSDDEDK